MSPLRWHEDSSQDDFFLFFFFKKPCLDELLSLWWSKYLINIVKGEGG